MYIGREGSHMQRTNVIDSGVPSCLRADDPRPRSSESTAESRHPKPARYGLVALAVAALVAATGVQSMTEAPSASADASATVEAQTQRVSDANFTSAQDGSYAPVSGGSGAAQAARIDRATGRTQGSNPGTVGQCTWGAAQKWFEASGSHPAFRGDALAWRDSAIAAGWTVVDEAQDRSIVVFQPGIAGASAYGHVAWVDSVSQRADGRWIHVTEMNNSQLGGVGIFNDRDIKDVPGMSYILLP
jgi:surface antigen